jgi:hypothetical protein
MPEWGDVVETTTRTRAQLARAGGARLADEREEEVEVSPRDIVHCRDAAREHMANRSVLTREVCAKVLRREPGSVAEARTRSGGHA